MESSEINVYVRRPLYFIWKRGCLMRSAESGSSKSLAWKSRKLGRRVLANTDLYLLILPALAILFIFKYMPLYGAQIAFKDYNIRLGFDASPWVGVKHFRNLFNSPDFYRIFRNTIILNLYRLVFQFPIPIIMALSIYELRNRTFKRTIQTLSYLPHFLSWVVIGAIFMNLLSTQGLINSVMGIFGAEPVVWLGESKYFRGLLVISDAWKNSGWGSIVYLSALSNVDTSLYDVANIDGANRFQKIQHIAWPAMLPTTSVLLILNAGAILNTDFTKVLLMQNDSNRSMLEVINTFVYHQGIESGHFEYATAVNLFISIICLILVYGTNAFVRKTSPENNLW